MCRYITRHGDTVGYYIPARRKRTEADRAALKEALIPSADKIQVNSRQPLPFYVVPHPISIQILLSGINEI